MRISKRTLFPTFMAVCAAFVTIGAESQESSFRDDFTGKSLRPEWSIRAQDADRWALTEDEYLFLITTIQSKEAGAVNRFVYNGDIPNNYEVVIKIKTLMNFKDYDSFNRVFLGIEKDFENRISLEVGGDGTIIFDKYLKGERSRLEQKIGESSGEFSMRIEKNGVEFEASYSLDDSTWQTLGKQFFINLNGKPVIGGYNTSEDEADAGVGVDYFELIQK